MWHPVRNRQDVKASAGTVDPFNRLCLCMPLPPWCPGIAGLHSRRRSSPAWQPRRLAVHSGMQAIAELMLIKNFSRNSCVAGFRSRTSSLKTKLASSACRAQALQLGPVVAVPKPTSVHKLNWYTNWYTPPAGRICQLLACNSFCPNLCLDFHKLGFLRSTWWALPRPWFQTFRC